MIQDIEYKCYLGGNPAPCHPPVYTLPPWGNLAGGNIAC